jgi:hypothetical protein
LTLTASCERWLLLEPINKPNRGNTVFVDSYVRKNLADTEYFPGQFGDVPKNGDTVTVGDQQLKWHALDSSLFDVKLYNFAWGLSKQTYGVIFWAVTVVNSPREIENVRMAVGSNSASMWWLNGKDRRPVWRPAHGGGRCGLQPDSRCTRARTLCAAR